MGWVILAGPLALLPAHATPPSPSPAGAGASAQARPRLASSGLTLFSIGEPSDEEQLYLEYLNRARANPAREAARLRATSDPYLLQAEAVHAIDLEVMARQLASLPPAPPLALNRSLSSAARSHSQDMLDHAFQDHTGSDGSSVESRLTAQNFFGDALGENLYTFAHGIEDGHGAFEVDWSDPPGPGGMADPPQHRLNLHDPIFQEVGIGVVRGTNGFFGPEVVTEDFGYRVGLPALLTGVASYDLDGDGFYSLGEGLGGVTVRADGSPFYAVTSSSGGYALPLPTNGTYAVTFSGPNLPAFTSSVTITNGENVKLDYAPAFQGAVVSGPAVPAVQLQNLYTFTPVGGATAYQWKWSRSVPVSGLIDGAEDGLAHALPETSNGYSVVATNTALSGTHSFHLLHPQPLSQVLTLTGVFRLGAAPQLSFATQLRLATTGEVARAQISLNRGRTWQEVWSQAGTGGPGEAAFRAQTVDLSAYSGKELMLRFCYEVIGATYFNSTGWDYGCYFDDVALKDAVELEETVSDLPAGGSFIFNPSQTGPYRLSVRALASGRPFDWGTEREVFAAPGLPQVPDLQILALRSAGHGLVQIDFSVAPNPPLAYEVQSAPGPDGPWTLDSAASVTADPAAAPGIFHALLPAGVQPSRFFRIVAQ